MKCACGVELTSMAARARGSCAKCDGARRQERREQEAIADTDRHILRVLALLQPGQHVELRRGDDGMIAADVVEVYDQGYGGVLAQGCDESPELALEHLADAVEEKAAKGDGFL